VELKQTGISRRGFLKGALATAATATPQTMLAGFTPFKSDSLQVWSCGGLSEAFNELNAIYESRTGHNIQYTGAFAGALGKGGALPTWMAAMIPDTLGIIAGLYLNWRVSR